MQGTGHEAYHPVPICRHCNGGIQGQTGSMDPIQQTDPTAVLGRRCVAWLLDNLIIAALFSVLLLSNATSTAIPDGVAADEACSFLFQTTLGCVVIGDEAWLIDVGLGATHVWLPTLAFLANHVFLTAKTGFSLGKAVTGLRVVRRSDGGLPGFTGAAGRALPWLVPVVLGILAPIMLVVEISLVFSSPGHRRLGDRIGGTLVVGREYAGETPRVPRLDST